MVRQAHGVDRHPEPLQGREVVIEAWRSWEKLTRRVTNMRLYESDSVVFHQPHVTLELDQWQSSVYDTKQNREVTNVMRTVFNIELKLDIPATDDERRKAFIELTLMTARQLYAQAAMISTSRPDMKVIGEGHQIPLFPENQTKEDEDEEDG